MVVKFTEKETGRLITNLNVQLDADNGVRCVTTSCVTNGRTWTGMTNSNGRVFIPSSPVDQSMTFTLERYMVTELRPQGARQSDGSWLVPLAWTQQAGQLPD